MAGTSTVSGKKITPGTFSNYEFSFFHTTIGPFLLMLIPPFLVILFWMTCVHFDGSLLATGKELSLLPEQFAKGGWPLILSQNRVASLWPAPSWQAAQIILVFAALELALLLIVPGQRYLGPPTPGGNQPRYILNGIPAYFITHIVLYVAAYHFKLFNPSIVYDNFGAILSTLVIFSFIGCFLLYLKGAYFPSSSDAGLSGNFVMDFFWGTELHPHLWGFNIKQYVNCRLGMMCWSVLLFAYAHKQYELSGYVSNSMALSVLIQVVYIVKFFYWESGYFGSLDIMHDRFGYYIFWGIMCWLPCTYPMVGLYLVKHPIQLSNEAFIAILVLGLVSIWVNYDADEQRQRVRLTQGQTTIWGKKPELIVARYKTADGKERENLLLVSGWWGVARHFHYIPEILLSLAWTLPALFEHALPYWYVVYLSGLLFHRSFRDEVRCSEKYGADWKKYCARVPYKIVPYIY